MSTKSTLVFPSISIGDLLYFPTDDLEAPYVLHYGLLLMSVSSMSGKSDAVFQSGVSLMLRMRSTVGESTTADGAMHSPFSVKPMSNPSESHPLVWPSSVTDPVVIWSQSFSGSHFNDLFATSINFGQVDIDSTWTSCGFSVAPFVSPKLSYDALTAAEANAHPQPTITYTG